MGTTGLWRESKRIDAVAQAHQRSLPAPPPKTLVVVKLWWTGANLPQGFGRFTCKTPVLVSGGTQIRTGGTMIFSHIQKPLGMW